MNDYNEVVIIGRTTQDIKKMVYGGQIKYTFIIASNYYSMNKKKTYSEFIPVCFWKDAEYKELEKVQKGDTVVINGRVSIHSYEAEDQKKWVTEVVGRYVRVFKRPKETKDMADLLALIKSNKALLDEITTSNQIKFSDDIMADLIGDEMDTVSDQ